MKGAEWRKIGENLGRFASIRETATEPSDRILVQAADGVVKIIAGAPTGSLVVTAHQTAQDFRAILPARDFLMALKSVSARGDFELMDLNKGWEVGASLVSTEPDKDLFSVDLYRMTKKFPSIIMPSFGRSWGSFEMDDAEQEELGKVVEASTADWAHDVQIMGKDFTDDGKIRISSWNRYVWAGRSIAGNVGLFGTCEAAFVAATRGLGRSKWEFFDDNRVEVTNGQYRAVGIFKPLGFAVSQTKPETITEVKYNSVVDRIGLIKRIRELTALDTYGTIYIQLAANTSDLTVSAGDSDYGWGVNGKWLIDLLSLTSDKKVGIGLRTGQRQPITVKVSKTWEILIAPVILRLQPHLVTT